MTAIISHGKNLYVILTGPCARLIKSPRCSLASKFCCSTLTRCVSSQLSVSEGVSEVAPNIQSKDTKKERPIWYYDNKGIRKRKIDQLVRKSLEMDDIPNTSEQVPDNTEQVPDVKHMRDLLYTFKICGFKTKDVENLLFSKPKVFGLTKRNVYNRLMDLLDYGYPKDVLKKMILSTPALLLIDDKGISLKTRMSNLKELNLTPKISPQRLVYLIQKCPGLLTISEKSVFESRLRNLHKLGLNKQLIYELVMKHPHVLTCSEKSVIEKINYVKNELRGQPTLFVKFPRAFTASLQRIKERHLYLREEGYFTGKSIMTEKKLRAIVLTSDKNFVYRVTRTTMKDYREFQRKLRKEEEEEKETGCAIDNKTALEDESNDKDFDEDDNEEYDDNEEGDDEDEEDGDNDMDYNGRGGKEEEYMDSFKSSRRRRNVSDEEFYSTPFPPQKEYNDNSSSTRARTRPYKPMKKKEYMKGRNQRFR